MEERGDVICGIEGGWCGEGREEGIAAGILLVYGSSCLFSEGSVGGRVGVCDGGGGFDVVVVAEGGAVAGAFGTVEG